MCPFLFPLCQEAGRWDYSPLLQQPDLNPLPLSFWHDLPKQQSNTQDWRTRAAWEPFRGRPGRSCGMQHTKGKKTKQEWIITQLKRVTHKASNRQNMRTVFKYNCRYCIWMEEIKTQLCDRGAAFSTSDSPCGCTGMLCTLPGYPSETQFPDTY